MKNTQLRAMCDALKYEDAQTKKPWGIVKTVCLDQFTGVPHPPLTPKINTDKETK